MKPNWIPNWLDMCLWATSRAYRRSCIRRGRIARLGETLEVWEALVTPRTAGYSVELATPAPSPALLSENSVETNT